MSSLNPESGSIRYTYDNDGNVLTKADPLVTTCWGNWSATAASCDGSGYDSLNEATLKSYSDGVTPLVSYSYTNGRLMSVGNNVSATSFTYDGLGRILTSSQQTLNLSPFSFQYSYNLTDALTSLCSEFSIFAAWGGDAGDVWKPVVADEDVQLALADERVCG
jgi:YD repeat-containing protein